MAEHTRDLATVRQQLAKLADHIHNRLTIVRTVVGPDLKTRTLYVVSVKVDPPSGQRSDEGRL